MVAVLRRLQSEGTPGVDDGIAMVTRLLGLPGMNVLGVTDGDNELIVTIETTETVGWCPGCGVRAQSQDRIMRSVRDLSCFGQAVWLDVRRRRWRCREVSCATRTWTEDVEQLDATAVLTRRAGAEACRQVGQQARPGRSGRPRLRGVLVDSDARGD